MSQYPSNAFFPPALSTAEREALTLRPNEMVLDRDLGQLFIGDGATLGGIALGSSSASFFVSKTGDDANSGLSKNAPLLTIQAAVDKAGFYNSRIVIGPGYYDEAIEIPATKSGLALIGDGNRGTVAVAQAFVRGDDVSFANLGCASAEDADYALKFSGDRFRAYGCKFEGPASGASVLAAAGTDAQNTAGTDGSAADFLFQDCESAWTAKGFVCQSSDYGAVTQGRIRGHRFHNCETVALGENDISTIGAVRNLLVEDCVFDNAEDGTAPTDYIDLNSVGSTGIIAGCRIAFKDGEPSEASVIQLAAGVRWVANMTEDGVSTGRPA